jgi:adenosylhomocysteine nucleosidase
MNAAVIISANAEWRAVRDLLGDRIPSVNTYPYGETFRIRIGAQEVDFFHGGWGKISAAASAQAILDRHAPDVLINLGTCGGFEGRIERGTIILVDRTLVYDILEQMSASDEAIDHYASVLDLGWVPEPWPHPVSRGLLVSADRDIVAQDIPMLIERYGAVAADWESGAIAWVARRNGARLLILRGVSDLVGSAGGEAYGNLSLFHERTRAVMDELLRQLPDWLANIKKQVPQ